MPRTISSGSKSIRYEAGSVADGAECRVFADVFGRRESIRGGGPSRPRKPLDDDAVRAAGVAGDPCRPSRLGGAWGRAGAGEVGVRPKGDAVGVALDPCIVTGDEEADVEDEVPDPDSSPRAC